MLLRTPESGICLPSGVYIRVHGFANSQTLHSETLKRQGSSFLTPNAYRQSPNTNVNPTSAKHPFGQQLIRLCHTGHTGIAGHLRHARERAKHGLLEEHELVLAQINEFYAAVTHCVRKGFVRFHLFYNRFLDWFRHLGFADKAALPRSSHPPG